MDTATTNDLILESALLKLPHELLKTNFKAQQKTIEKDITWLQNNLHQFDPNPNSTQDSAKHLAIVINRLHNLRGKIETLRTDEQSHAYSIRARLTHMEKLSSRTTSDKSDTDTRMQRMLIEFLLCQGLSDTAKRLASGNEIAKLLDIDVFVSSQRIANRLRQRSTLECISWCNEHKAVLRKNQNGLEFQIRRQEFIELIRNGQLVDAISFAQKNLSIHRGSRQVEVDQVCALLCYKPDTTVEPYKSLYSPSRWDYLAEFFLRTHNELYSIPSLSPLEVALSAGLSALKTAQCEKHMPNAAHPKTLLTKCPVCSPELNELARSMKIAYAARSHLVDAINGKAMEGDNEPVVLPNGRLYGTRTLSDWAEKQSLHKDIVMDPVTGEEFPKLAVRKAYIL